jgi:GNAT superfamily N-acetyltransferase
MSAPPVEVKTVTVPAAEPPKSSPAPAGEDPAMPSDPNSPDLEIVVATPEEIRLLSEKNAVAWRGGLKLEAYLRREVFLGSQTFTRDGGVTHWVLVSKRVKGTDRKILAGCETYRKRALVSRNGKIEEVQAHGIGSVFSEYRGKGYGARMMKELGEKLKTWQTLLTPNLFSVLYSDIGKVRTIMVPHLAPSLTLSQKFYSQLGWQSFPSSHVHIRPDASQSTSGKHSNVVPLQKTDLPNLCALDEKMMRKRLESYNEGTAVALVPDHKTIGTHIIICTDKLILMTRQNGTMHERSLSPMSSTERLQTQRVPLPMSMAKKFTLSGLACMATLISTMSKEIQCIS